MRVSGHRVKLIVEAPQPPQFDGVSICSSESGIDSDSSECRRSDSLSTVSRDSEDSTQLKSDLDNKSNAECEGIATMVFKGESETDSEFSCRVSDLNLDSISEPSDSTASEHPCENGSDSNSISEESSLDSVCQDLTTTKNIGPTLVSNLEDTSSDDKEESLDDFDEDLERLHLSQFVSGNEFRRRSSCGDALHGGMKSSLNPVPRLPYEEYQDKIKYEVS